MKSHVYYRFKYWAIEVISKKKLNIDFRVLSGWPDNKNYLTLTRPDNNVGLSGSGETNPTSIFNPI